jgi:hypothetical protein
MRCYAHALDQKKSDFLLNLDTHVVYPGMQVVWIFFANLICLLFSIFTNDADKVIFITNNIILVYK